MLTIARGLATEPKLLLVDEPTEGLMPELVGWIRESLMAIQKHGVAILLVEQNTKRALGITHVPYRKRSHPLPGQVFRPDGG